jgi:hypothetical protein
MIGPDFLRGLERRAILVAVVLAVAALVWPRTGTTTGPMRAVAVLGGALLSGISYFGIRRGVDGLTAAMSGGASVRAGLVRTLTMLVGRYALLALIAYVMISRLRLSPLGVLVGVSVIPLAVAIEAIVALAGFRKTERGNHGKA